MHGIIKIRVFIYYRRCLIRLFSLGEIESSCFWNHHLPRLQWPRSEKRDDNDSGRKDRDHYDTIKVILMATAPMRTMTAAPMISVMIASIIIVPCSLGICLQSHLRRGKHIHERSRQNNIADADQA